MKQGSETKGHGVTIDASGRYEPAVERVIRSHIRPHKLATLERWHFIDCKLAAGGDNTELSQISGHCIAGVNRRNRKYDLDQPLPPWAEGLLRSATWWTLKEWAYQEHYAMNNGDCNATAATLGISHNTVYKWRSRNNLINT